MTEKEQNIAIAEALGWNKFGFFFGGTPGRYPPLKNQVEEIPNYTNDLNAMHEVEKMFIGYRAHGWRYWETLCRVCGIRPETAEWERLQKLGHATAAQRAEAFLKTKGLWK